MTKIDLIQESPTQFPTITICNLNIKNTKYNLNETIISCKFGSDDCNLDEFDWIRLTYGYCFMFNSGKNHLKKKILLKNSTLAGHQYSFRLKLFVDPLNATDKAPLSR